MTGEVPVKWDKNRRGWHLDKTVSISHVVSFAAIAVAIIIKADDIEDRTQANQQAIEQTKVEIDRLDRKLDKMLDLLKG